MADFSELNLIGQSSAFTGALELIGKFATCDATVLVQGETGTGKELAARAIHYLSKRRGFPFIPVNCGALPDSLVENELFGHVRGAYTDARENHGGLVADAEGGTLFLDEIEALSAKAQVILLRFLQDREYRPLGGRLQLRGNVRIVTATNADLMELVRSGAFREDLLFRLAILSVKMPALRERLGDPVVLAQHFLRRFAAQYERPQLALDKKAIDILATHHWPGNVRELENGIHRAVLLADSGAMALASSWHPAVSAIADAPVTLTDFCFQEARARALSDFERTYIEQLLGRSRGNVSLAARISGKERSRLTKLMKKHGIVRSQYIN
jgi:two-component system response regulator GlrR